MYFLVSVIVLLFVKSSQQINETENIQSISSIDNDSSNNASSSLTDTLEDLEPYNSTFEQIDQLENATDFLHTNESGPVETIVYAPIIIHLSNAENTSTFRRRNPLHHLLHGIVPHSVLRPITHLFGGHHHHQGPLAFLNPFFYLTRNLNGTQEVATN